MYRVFLTRTNITVQILQTESQAEKFCEGWGWKYDGSEGSGFIDYEEIKEESENVQFKIFHTWKTGSKSENQH